MQIGKTLLAKYEGKVQQFKVIKIMQDDLELSNGEITIIRKFWEVRSTKNEEES
jgi:hypothetical protein